MHGGMCHRHIPVHDTIFIIKMAEISAITLFLVNVSFQLIEERLRDYVSSQDWYESEQGVISSVHLPLPMLSL